MNISAMKFINDGLKPIYYLKEFGLKVSTFIYYRGNASKINGYNHETSITVYDSNDEYSKRYKYFIYKEIINE